MYQLHTEKQRKYFFEAIRLHYEEGYGSDRIERILPVGHSTILRWIAIFAKEKGKMAMTKDSFNPYYQYDEDAALAKAAREAFALQYIREVRAIDPVIGGTKLWYMYKTEFSAECPIGRDRFCRILDEYGLKVRLRITPWLAEDDNINLLGETVGMELEVQEQEAKVGTFSADILCKEINTDRCVVIENQLEKTDHDHLGKVITYCSGLDAYTAIWIAKSFDEEHRAAIDWLNSIADDNYNFFGIEIRLFKIGDSALAPQFDIVAKPNNWSKTIKKQVSGNTETEKLRLDFWNAYFDYVEKKGLDILTHARATTDHWSDFRVGIAGFHYANILTVKNWIGVQIYLGGDNPLRNKSRYDLIESKCKVQIDGLQCKKIEWKRLDEKKASYVGLKLEADIRDKSDWQRQFDWMYKTMMELHKIVKPHYGEIRKMR